MKNLKKNITPGTTLLSEKPFVYCLSSKVRTEYCDYCFQRGMLLKCTACQYVYYCGKVCQKEGWSMHKPECKNLKKIAPRIIPDAARMLARMIRKLSKNGNQVKSYYTENTFRMYKDLMSHYPIMKNDKKKLEHFQSLCVVLEEFIDGEILPNPVDLIGMFGRMCINSFNICNEEQQILGTGIYLGASVLDHSCEPNAIAIFEGTTLHIRALKSMPYLNWSKVFISYIDVLNTTEERIEDLKRVYYFTCECEKCLAPDPEEMLAACCPNISCDNAITFVGSEKCSKCGKHINKEFWSRFQEVTELTDIHLRNMKELAYYDACKICLEKQKGVLHKLNIKYIKTLDLTFESCICLGKFEEAVDIGKQLEEPFQKYYGKFHPLTGLLYLKLSKILFHLNFQEEALKMIKNAYDILKVTHGTQSQIFREELLPLLQQCR